jgi:hypothetical protein
VARAPRIQTATIALVARPDGTRDLYVDPASAHTLAEYAVCTYADSRGTEVPGHGGTGSLDALGHWAGAVAALNLAEHPFKAADHAMDATRYALHAELPTLARAEALLAALRQWVGRSG